MRRWILLLLIAWPSSAFANAEADARREFEAGTAALKTGRFAAARDNFRRALALVPKAASAFNLGVALRGTGEPVEAAQMFEALLAEAYGALQPAQREQLGVLLGETRAEIATLEVRVEGAPVAELKIDGRRVRDLVAGELHVQQVDPNSYVVRATAPQRLPAEERVQLARGGTVRVDLELVEPPQVATLIVDGAAGDLIRVEGIGEGGVPFERTVAPGAYHVVATGPSGERATDVTVEAGQTLRVRLEAEPSGLLASPWFWGAVVVVAAGLTATTVVLAQDRTTDPVRDPTYGIVSALRGR